MNLKLLMFCTVATVLVRSVFADAAPVFETEKAALTLCPKAALTEVPTGCELGNFTVSAEPVLKGRYDGNCAWEVTVAHAEGVVVKIFDWNDKPVQDGIYAASKFIVSSPALWSAENPNLYKIVITDGAYWSAVPFGFRESEVKETGVCLNGQTLVLKEVKVTPAHEDEFTDDAQRLLEYKNEIRRIKSLNANTVRVGAHTNESLWRYLCDTEGLYLISPMASETDLNHPSVLKVDEKLITCVDTRCAFDREKDPVARSVHHAYQNWRVTQTNFFQRVVVANLNRFVDSQGVTLTWHVLRDGRETAKGSFALYGLKPQKSAVYDMPAEVAEARLKGGTISIRFDFEKAGSLIAQDQIDIVATRSLEGLMAEGGRVDFEESATAFIFKAQGIRYVFSKETGLLTSWTRKNWTWRQSEYLKSPQTVRFDSRAVASEVSSFSSIENHRGALTFAANQNLRETETLQVVAKVQTRWTIYPNGSLACDAMCLATSGADGATAFGWGFPLVEKSPRVEWFGKGPWGFPSTGSAADAAFLGRWTDSAEVFFSSDPEARGFATREQVCGARVGDWTFRTLLTPFRLSLCEGFAPSPESQTAEVASEADFSGESVAEELSLDEIPEEDEDAVEPSAAVSTNWASAASEPTLIRDHALVYLESTTSSLAFTISWRDSDLTARSRDQEVPRARVATEEE